jgi:CBS domain-containing protein
MAAEVTVQQLLETKPSKVYSVAPDATVLEGLKVMSEAKIGALPVIEGERLVGIFSERDYARRIILEGRHSKDTQIREVMTAGVCCVSPDETIKECMALMNKNRFRHLPVVQGEVVVGIVSIGDVVRAILMSLL